jgi:hypothetical protein
LCMQCAFFIWETSEVIIGDCMHRHSIQYYEQHG